MTKYEIKFFEFIRKHIVLLLFASITVFALVLRLNGMPFASDDYRRYLLSWWYVISSKGIEGLTEQVGNYNIPYQMLIFILSRFQIDPLVAYKIVSIGVDFLLAVSAALLVKQHRGEKFFSISPVLTYSVVLCSLTVIFNSAFWAQCDCIYVSFILLSIYFLMEEKNIPAFIFLGLAFTFKLQAVFILPVFLFYYATTRKCSILHFLIVPVTDIILCLPAVFMGRPFMDIFKIYAGQVDEVKQLQLNIPNMYAFFIDGSTRASYENLSKFTIIFTFVILLGGLALLFYKKADLTKWDNFLMTAIWTSFTCVMFLSSMHERYAYLLDILVIVYAIAMRRHYVVALLCNLISLRGYGYYLFDNYEAISIGYTAIVYVGLYFYVTYLFIKEVVMSQPASNPVAEKLSRHKEKKKKTS